MSWYTTLSLEELVARRQEPVSVPLDELVARLQKANYAYHNGGEEIMGDDEYDRGLEELRRRSPAHPFLKMIGAPVSQNGKGAVLLPYTMASLDKVRYNEGGLARWLKRSLSKDIVIMEKLDGLSALCVVNHQAKKSLYLRGDGVKGVDVSRACPSLGILPVPCVVRGEILLPNDKTPEGSIGRSLVNGWLHRAIGSSEPVARNDAEVVPQRNRILDLGAEIPAELKNCHFVAYQVIEPAGLTRSQQITWLQCRGFKIPSYTVVKASELNEDKAKDILTSWKSSSKYPLDGIVLGFDKIPMASPGGEAKNPDDAVAFKASLDDQKAETSIVNIEWNLSRQGVYIPRIQIKPVVIGGARIEWLSGHNAGFVQTNKLGPGAQIVIRRSGDVIPTLDTVLKGVSPSLPESGTWNWDESHVQAKAKATESESDKSIQHCLSTLGIEGVGPGLVKKLYEGGFTTMKKIYDADGSTLGKCIGSTRGPSLASDLKSKVSSATQLQLLIATNLLPRGVGEKKLRGLYAIEGDALIWTKQTLGTPSGWSSDSVEELLEALPKAFQWLSQTFGTAMLEVKSVEAPITIVHENTKYVVFTGCRPKALPSGWVMEDSVTKKTNLLVVSDSAIDKETTKTKKAKEMGIKIISLSEFH